MKASYWLDYVTYEQSTMLLVPTYGPYILLVRTVGHYMLLVPTFGLYMLLVPTYDPNMLLVRSYFVLTNKSALQPLFE